jgi:hypothetical protein
VTVLADLNSTVRIDPDSQAGTFDWVVDGVDQLSQQWFWYRIGSGAEQSINTLSAASVSATATHAEITYSAGGLEFLVKYDLTGGTAGSFTSDLAETIRIRNLGTSSIDMHFFQYSDFDLNGVAGGQSVQFFGAGFNKVAQTGLGIEMSETVVVPDATHHEANLFSTTRTSLNNGTATTLNDSNSAGPGDVTWAYQWDVTVAAGGSFIISKDKHIHAVPEPASLGIWGLVAAVSGFAVRRRSGSAR